MYGSSNHGGTNKCFRFYEDLAECSRAAGRNDYYIMCKNEREDYLECLHQKKQYHRAQRIQSEKKKLVKEGKWPPKPEAIASSAASSTSQPYR
eukprot:gene4646-5254_t